MWPPLRLTSRKQPKLLGLCRTKSIGVCVCMCASPSLSLCHTSNPLRLHEAIMEVGGSRMQTQQAYVDKIKADIDKSNSEIAKANVCMKTAARLGNPDCGQ